MRSLKALFALLVVAAGIFLGYKLIPPYLNNYELQNEITNISRVATYAQAKTEDDVRADVIAKAKEEGVDLKPEQVTVQKDNTACNIDVRYEVAVPVPGYTFNLTFNPSAGNRQITAK